MKKWFFFPTALLILATAAPRAGADSTADGNEFFEKKIRPILIDQCGKCHGGTKPKGKLSLTSREALLKGGDTGPAMVPGQPEQSLLIKAIRYTDDVLRMPPRSKLPDSQVTDLTAWVAIGAPWPNSAAVAGGPTGKETFNLKERRKHWAWQPLHAVTPPPVRSVTWTQSPIDAFILAGLEANGSTPAPPAERRSLIRRLTFDLIGLPPTPAQIDAFLADRAPDAYERLVERLLSSPHYGERWGRHWLDLVRFAETYGHEYDFDMPEAAAYRDYVIRAFNADIPYDQWVTEHVAGDLLDRPRRHAVDGFNESIIGTGFWFLGEAAHSPVDVRADQADHIDNQIDVFAKTFLGLTVACARCHDHKFDAISTNDYYALAGYLESSRMQRAFIDPPERIEPALRGLQYLHRQARLLAEAMTAKAMKQHIVNLPKYLAAERAGRRNGASVAELDQWTPAFRKPSLSQADHVFHPWTGLAPAGADLTPEQFDAKRRELVQGLKALKTHADQVAAKELPPLLGPGQPANGAGEWFVTGDAFGPGPLPEPDVVLHADPQRPIQVVLAPGTIHSGLVAPQLKGVVRSATFTISKKNILYHVAGRQGRINLILDGLQLIRDPIYGGLTFGVDHGDAWHWHVQDVSMWLGQRAYVEIIDDGPGFVAVDRILFSDDGPPALSPSRLLLRLLDDAQVRSAETLAKKYQDLLLAIVNQWQSGELAQRVDGAERLALLNWFLEMGWGAAGAATDDGQRVAAMLARAGEIEGRLPEPRRALAMADGTGWNEHVFIRGNPRNLGEEVPRRLLEALAGDQPRPQHGSGRLDLAHRLVDPANPLLARVLVNRLWQHHFGEGLVRSVDNFGVLGERPTNPALLDYLAAELIRSGWSIKRLHRLLVLSNTYRMASRPDPAEQARDPQNQRLHRMPLRRLEAECIRDAILAVSGRLDRTMYGPGIMPYLTPHMVGRGRPGASGPLDGGGRRSIYLSVRRNFLTPMFLAFDYPIPFTTMGRRSASNVPAQALALMNNPFVVQEAQRWGQRIAAEPAMTTRQRIVWMYETAFGRPPDEAELREAQAFVGDSGGSRVPSDSQESWGQLGHVLFNVKEFIFID
jgi:hypothetical protein